MQLDSCCLEFHPIATGGWSSLVAVFFCSFKLDLASLGADIRDETAEMVSEVHGQLFKNSESFVHVHMQFSKSMPVAEHKEKLDDLIIVGFP